MSIRNKFALSLTAVLAALSLTACSGSSTSSSSETGSTDNSSSAPESSAAESTAPADSSDNAESTTAGEETAYSPENPVTVRIGLTGNIYEEIWNPIKEKLAPEGINIEYQQFTSFNIPNNALNSGEIEMNAFQHHAYFNNDTATNGYDLTVIADTFVMTMNLYSNKYATYEDLLAAVEAGEELTVVVPNDATNYGRALILLRDAGLIELSEYESTPNVENIISQKVKLEEVNASMTYQYLDNAAACAVNGNYAASYGVDPASAIFDETVDLSDESFICLIAVRTEDADNEVYNRIADVFCSDVTGKVIHEKFDGFFSPIWEQEAAE